MRAGSRPDINKRQDTPSPQPGRRILPEKKMKDFPASPTPKPIDSSHCLSNTDFGDERSPSRSYRRPSSEDFLAHEPENLPVDYQEETFSKTHTLSTTKKLRNPFQDGGSLRTSPDKQPYRRNLTYQGSVERGTVVLGQTRVADEVERLRSEVTRLKSENIKLQKEQTKLIYNFEDEIRRIRKKSASTPASDVDERILQAEVEKKRLQDALDDYIKKTEAINRAKDKRIRELEDELSNERIKVHQLENQVKSLGSTSPSNKKDAEETIANLRKENDRLLADLNLQKSTAESRIHQQEQAAAILRSQILDLDDKLRNLQNENQRLSQNLQAQVKRADELERLSTILQPKVEHPDVEKLKQELESEKRVNSALKDLLKDRELEIARKEAEFARPLQEKNAEIAALKEQVSRSLDDKTKVVMLMIEIERLHGVIAQLTLDIQNLKQGFQKEIEGLTKNYEIKIQILESNLKAAKALDPKIYEQRINEYELNIKSLMDELSKARQDANYWKDKYEGDKTSRGTISFGVTEEEKEKKAGVKAVTPPQDEIQKAQTLLLELKNKELQEKANSLEEKVVLLSGEIERLQKLSDELKAENTDLKEKCSEIEANYEKAINGVKDKIEEFVKMRIGEELKNAEFEWIKEKDAKDRLIEAQKKLINRLKENVGNMNDDLKLLNDIKVKEQDVIVRMERNNDEMSDNLKNIPAN